MRVKFLSYLIISVKVVMHVKKSVMEDKRKEDEEEENERNVEEENEREVEVESVFNFSFTYQILVT